MHFHGSFHLGSTFVYTPKVPFNIIIDWSMYTNVVWKMVFSCTLNVSKKNAKFDTQRVKVLRMFVTSHITMYRRYVGGRLKFARVTHEQI